MPDEKPAKETPKKVEAKMVPEGDLIAFKKGSLEREKRLKEELAKEREKVTQLNSEIRVSKLNTEDDEEVSKVKQYLVDEEKRIRLERAKLDDDLTSFNEREREGRVQALVTRYGIDIESISGEEDPEKKALELYAERLTKEKEELEAQKPPESVFETATPGTVQTQPKDMDDATFEKHRKTLRAKALSKS